MKDIKWYSDQSAEHAYRMTKARLEPVVADLFPDYELSHLGVNRNHDTEEVVIKLHLIRSEPWPDDHPRIPHE